MLTFLKGFAIFFLIVIIACFAVLWCFAYKSRSEASVVIDFKKFKEYYRIVPQKYSFPFPDFWSFSVLYNGIIAIGFSTLDYLRVYLLWKDVSRSKRRVYFLESEKDYLYRVQRDIDEYNKKHGLNG